MVIFLVKSAACMLFFFLFYKLLLEQESMHKFKRFYLLAALVISFIIPSIVLTEYVEVRPATSSLLTTIPSATPETSQNPVAAQAIDPFDWTLFLWIVYGIGFLGFAIRFFGHLFQIRKRIKKNPKLKGLFITKVLLLEQLPPHTFFSYIFVNKKKFENNDIPEEVMLHEETHAKQRHSIDVLFVEFLQILFWFNPLVHLYKTAIKLNHEFLADNAVLKKNQNSTNYQNTLLSYLSHDSAEKYQSTGIANAINYSSIKKRFTIMKKQTSKKSILLRSLLLIPLLALLLFGFSSSKLVVKKTNSALEITNYTARSLSIEILENGNYLIEEKKANKDNFKEVINQFNTDVKPEIRNKILNIHLTSSKEIANSEIWFVYNSVLEYGFYRIVTPNQEIIREKGNKPFADEVDRLNELAPNLIEKGSDNLIKSRLNQFQILVTSTPKGIKLNCIEGCAWLELDFTLDTGAKQLLDKYGMVDSRQVNEKNTDNLLISFEKTGEKILLHGLKGTAWNKLSFSLAENKPQKINQLGNVTEQQNFSKEQILIAEVIEIRINKSGQVLIKDKIVSMDELPTYLSKINTHLSFEQRKKTVRSIVRVDTNTPKDVIQKVDQILTEYGCATINIIGAEDSPRSKVQSSATRKEMKEYNALAKKYNEMDRSNMIIKKKDVERLKYIYGLMSDKQRADAEPFPDFPKPPPPPPPAPVPDIEDVKELPPPPPSPRMHKGRSSDVPPPPAPRGVNEIIEVPPPPPPPKTPLDHVIEMAKKDAVFYYQDEKISSDRAIQILKENDKINIDSRANGKRPIVKLSTAPIVIEN
ncbi:M56 family metallopeptidase [Maribacter algicola]|uniref:M56 family metallopeptidase n=1 Tax=Meishania litoralis TaxID=3434685 RepID=A0ACC7LLM7_9FLAO